MRNSNARLERVDDLRAVAACLVLASHAALHWKAAHSGVAGPFETYLGRMGVAIFFVISGLVIYRPFVVARMHAQRIDWTAYAGRRLMRIFPAYLLAAAVFVYVVPFSPGSFQPLSPWLLFGLGQIYTPATYFAGLSVAWTLCIEMTFYVAVPFLALAVAGRRKSFELWLLLGLVVGSTVIRLVAGGTLLGYFAWFALGMLLARMSCGSPRPLPLPAWTIWLVVAMGYAAVALRIPEAGGLAWDYIGLGLLAGVAVLPAVTHAGRSYLSWLGDRSYGVYLWHYPVFIWLAQQPEIPLATYIVGGTMLTLLAAHGSYRYLERPLMTQLAKAQRARRRPVDLVAQTAAA
jgi:peptidoglycan/LPS O-acetylase OafA/YrhL